MIDKESYIEALRTFENFHDFSLDISDNTGGLTVPCHLVRANQLYVRLTLTSLSIIHLLPENRLFPSEWKVWDFFSVASLARNLIENYHMFYYVAVEEISDEERGFRMNLLWYHLNSEKYKLYLDLKKTDLLKDFEDNLPIEKQNLKEHPFFKTLPKDKARKILSGNESMYLTNREISERINFNTEEFKPLYRLFSNHTHSSPLGFFSMSNERGRGKENEAEVSYLTLTLQLCTKYLSAAMLDMTKLFPQCAEKIDKLKVKKVEEIFSSLINIRSI